MSGEQYQQGEDFQSAKEHQEGTHQFGKSGHNGEIDIWIPSIKVGIEYDGGIHGQKDNQEKDTLKNSLIADSKECGKLYRIRELEAADMSGDNEKICLIRMKETLSLTSIKGRNELSRVINILLKKLLYEISGI